MNESLLQYAWQFRLFATEQIATTDGTPINIIDVGNINYDAGPDFFNAKVKIGDTLWAGNVEIHCLASDWFRHHHDTDDRYDSIILHVVGKSDLNIHRKNGETIPQIELKLKNEILENFNHLKESQQWIRCGALWNRLDPIFLKFQLSYIVYERIRRKAQEILSKQEQNKNDWATTLYQQLTKGFGMHTNALPFEMMAKQTPLKVVAHQQNALLEMEALFFGQANLLREDTDIEYEKSLFAHYRFLKSKYNLSPIDGSLWKFAKMRPTNFPYTKIAQLSALIFQSSHLFSKIIETDDLQQLCQLFHCKASAYWSTHYRFGDSLRQKKDKSTDQEKQLNKSSRQLTKTSIHSLIINVVVPIKFAYHEQRSDELTQDDTLQLLEKIPAEKNGLTDNWRTLILPELGEDWQDEIRWNAYTTQALIELKTQYCDLNKCLRCQIGRYLIGK